MNRNNIYVAAFFLISSLSLSGCKDNVAEEITKLEVDRAFSPTGLTATVVDKTGVRLAWKAVNNAKTYTIEIFENTDFSGSPVKTVNNITFLQVPYTVTGLAGDTQYGIRVKAVGEGVTDSKWITATAKTDAEQILQAVDAAKLTANSVTLNWPAGEAATTITLTPGNITHTVTAAEVAAGEAVITGLIPETSYAARLTNGAKVRGTITFKTAVDIGNAKLINSVAEFTAALSTAVGGESYAFASGTYDFTGTTIAVTKSISIVAVRATERPLLNNVNFNVQSGASLKLKNLIIDGGNVPNYAVSYAIGNFGDLEIDGSVVKNYKAGIIGITAALSTVSSILINNNIFNTFGTDGEFIDFRTGFANKFTFTNNTLYGQSEREFIRMDNAAGATYPAAKIIINVSNNTFYGVGNYASSVRRLFYVRIPAANHEISFTKNIVANTTVLLANQSATNLTTLSGNNYFGTSNLISSSVSGAKIDAGGTALNPGFTDPATGNFTISQPDLKTNGIGDPRWIN
ncbi:DUF4957 domain-containing protein [Pedobacter chinensis]|nr:DUF4957 domain-containing protein [Pedobacter chinensis]